MGLNILTLGSSKTYTDESLIGLGSLKGAPCTIKSITEVDGGQKVTFEWTGTSGTKQTSEMTVKNGVSITSIDIDSDNNLVCTMSDGTEQKAKINILDNVYTKSETNTLLLDKAEKNHNHDSAYASKDTEHEHTNKETLDKFGVNDGGKLTFNGDVVTPEAMDLGDYLKKTDAQNTYVEKETGKGLSENDFTTVLKDAYDKAVEDSHTHSNKSIIDKFSEDSDGKLLYDGQSIEADLSTVYKKTETYSQTESDDKFVAKESGKGLSANDLTNDLKSSYDDAVTAKHTHENGTVLDGITAEKVEAWDKAEENVQSDWNETDDTADGFIKNKPTIPDITGLATETYVDNKVADYTKTVDLADVATSGSYNDLADKPTIPSLDGYAKTSEIPSKISELENDSNYLSSIPEEYVTETELSAKGYLTEHQDISGKVDKVEGKSLISDTEIARLATVDNYDDTDIKAEIAKKADATAIPSKVSELTNDSNYQTAEQVNSTVTTEIAKVVADAPESLNTLKEMSDWIAGHEDDASAMNSAISDNKTAITALQTGKADKSEIPTTVAELTDSADYAKKTDLHSHENKTVLDGITSTKVSDWDSAKTHADSAHAPSNAQENVLETVKVNGTALEVSNKAVNVTVPTTVAELTDSADYAKTADVNNSISTLQTDKANASDLTAHTDDADIHVTAENKATWNTVSDKVDKEDGKGLSANDYTNEEKALVGTIEDKINKTSIVTALDDTVTDEQVTSALLAKTELDKKIDKTSIATELSDASTDDEVVGALTAYNELQKLESANKEQFATASGDYITVTDSVDGKLVELGIKGNSFQKIYSGKNLYNPTLKTCESNGITCTQNVDANGNPDGTYTLNGTASSDVYFNLGNVNIIPGNKYRLCCTKSDTDIKAYMEKGLTGYEYNTLTATSSIANVTVSIKSGVILSNVRIKPMLTTDLNATYDDFEPYVGGIPSPNPSYPQTINSVGDDGSLVIKSCGKNLLNPTLKTSTINGVTCTNNGDGTYTLNGTATDDCNFTLTNKSITEDGKTYRIVGCPSGGSSNTYRLAFWGGISPEYGSGTIFTNEDLNATYKYLYINIVSGYTCNNLVFKPMITTDINATYDDFEPYKGLTTTIPLSEPLRSIGDIKDEITYQNGKWGILRRIKEINLTDLAWELVNNGTYQYWRYSVNDGKEASSYNTIANIIAEKYMASSWYNTVQLNSATNAIAYGFNANNTSSKLIAVHNGSTTESPTGKFLYELVTPTFEPFADQTLPYLSTYDGVTNISNDDALSAEMTVKYPTTDASGVGSRNESRIADIDKNKVDKSSVVTTLGSSSTDTQVPSAKAVWNKSKNKIQRLLDGVDIIVYADSISNEMATDTVRILNGTNSPYGVDNVNNDFHYTIYNINDDKYKRILAYDIRKNDMYMIVKNKNIWGTWAKLATMDKLGGLTFSASGTTLSITDGTNTWTLEANS